jgi:hypothetical protein
MDEDTEIYVTLRRILNSGYWEEYCSSYGINPYAINEGRVLDTEKVSIKESDYLKWFH